MDFCPNCNNIFDITSNPNPTNNSKSGGFGGSCVTGGASTTLKELITSIIDNNFSKTSALDPDSDEFKTYSNLIKHLNLADLVNIPEYKSQKAKQKEYIYNLLKDIQDDLNKSDDSKSTSKSNLSQMSNIEQKAKVYLICKNCGYLKPVVEQTLIFTKASGDSTQNYIKQDCGDMVNSDIIQRTRRYVCPNKSCKTNEDASLKEAVFFRLNNQLIVKYICTYCNTQF